MPTEIYLTNPNAEPQYDTIPENEVLDTLSDGGDDWFAASKVNDVLDIINEYI